MLPPTAVNIALSSPLKVGQHGRNLLVSANLISPGPVTKGHPVFNSRDLPSIPGQSETVATAFIVWGCLWDSLTTA